jgi:hypothetical protein
MLIGVTGRARTVVMLASLTGAQAPASAQGAFKLDPLFQTALVYDSNPTFTPSGGSADFITRVTPGLEARYLRPQLTISTRYTFDMERFTEHAELTRVDARQHAGLDVSYRKGLRWTLAANAELSKTSAPGELAPQTGLAFGRADARRIASRASVTHRMTARTTGSIGYSLAADSLEGGFASRTHGASFALDHRTSARGTSHVAYRAQDFAFGDSSVVSHTLAGGWNRSIGPHLSFSLSAGPRLTGRSFAPEASASLGYQDSARELSIAYTRSQTTIIGLPGVADTQSVTSSAAWIGRSLQLRVAPAFYRSDLSGAGTNVYRVTAEATRRLGRRFSAGVVVDSTVQDGSLNARLLHEFIPRHVVLVKLASAPAVPTR